MDSASLSSHQRYLLKDDPLLTEPWLEWVTLGKSFCRAMAGRNRWTRVQNKGQSEASCLPFVSCTIFLASQQTITASALIQDIRKTKLDWDQPLASSSVGGLRSITCHPWLSFAYLVATFHAKWVASSVNCNCILPQMHQNLVTAHQHT